MTDNRWRGVGSSWHNNQFYDFQDNRCPPSNHPNSNVPDFCKNDEMDFISQLSNMFGGMFDRDVISGVLTHFKNDVIKATDYLLNISSQTEKGKGKNNIRKEKKNRFEEVTAMMNMIEIKEDENVNNNKDFCNYNNKKEIENENKNKNKKGKKNDKMIKNSPLSVDTEPFVPQYFLENVGNVVEEKNLKRFQVPPSKWKKEERNYQKQPFHQQLYHNLNSSSSSLHHSYQHPHHHPQLDPFPYDHMNYEDFFPLNSTQFQQQSFSDQWQSVSRNPKSTHQNKTNPQNKKEKGQTTILTIEEAKLKLEKLKKQKVLVLLRGCPGSGKSTMARKIVNGGKILSTDDFFIVGNNYEYDKNKLSEAHEWNQRQALKEMVLGVTPLIIDNTNTQVWQMLPYVQFALDRKYTVEVIEPKVSWRSKPSILAKKNIHKVNQNKIIDMLRNYESHVTADQLINIVMNQKNELNNWIQIMYGSRTNESENKNNKIIIKNEFNNNNELKNEKKKEEEDGFVWDKEDLSVDAWLNWDSMEKEEVEREENEGHEKEESEKYQEKEDKKKEEKKREEKDKISEEEDEKREEEDEKSENKIEKNEEEEGMLARKIKKETEKISLEIKKNEINEKQKNVENFDKNEKNKKLFDDTKEKNFNQYGLEVEIDQIFGGGEEEKEEEEDEIKYLQSKIKENFSDEDETPEMTRGVATGVEVSDLLLISQLEKEGGVKTPPGFLKVLSTNSCLFVGEGKRQSKSESPVSSFKTANQKIPLKFKLDSSSQTEDDELMMSRDEEFLLLSNCFPDIDPQHLRFLYDSYGKDSNNLANLLTEFGFDFNDRKLEKPEESKFEEKIKIKEDENKKQGIEKENETWHGKGVPLGSPKRHHKPLFSISSQSKKPILDSINSLQFQPHVNYFKSKKEAKKNYEEAEKGSYRNQGFLLKMDEDFARTLLSTHFPSAKTKEILSSKKHEEVWLRPQTAQLLFRDWMDSFESIPISFESQKISKSVEAGHLATKIKWQRLQKRFSNLNKQILLNIFQASGYSEEVTVDTIQNSTLSVPPKNNMTSEFMEDLELQLINKAIEESLKDLYEKDGEERKKEKKNLKMRNDLEFAYKEMRDQIKESIFHYKQKSEQAKNAMDKNQVSVASYYSEEAKNWERRIEEEKQLAAYLLFQQKHSTNQCILDLHGFSCKEVLSNLPQILKKQQEEYTKRPDKKNSFILLITGRGLHSAGGVPKLKPAVENYLEQNNYFFNEASPGILKVKIKS